MEAGLGPGKSESGDLEEWLFCDERTASIFEILVQVGLQAALHANLDSSLLCDYLQSQAADVACFLMLFVRFDRFDRLDS